MSYTLIRNREVAHKKAASLRDLLATYNDMYKYVIYISAGLVYVVEKETQPTDWEIGWAE